MSICTLSDKTTRRNRQKIVKETTNSYAWFLMSWTFRISAFSWATYSWWYSVDVWQWIIQYDKYLIQYTCSYEWNSTTLSTSMCMIPSDNSALWSYETLNDWATSKIQSSYLKWDTIVLNFTEWTHKKYIFDLITRTRARSDDRDTTWTLFDNTQLSFLWYQCVSDMVVSWSWSTWYTIHPYLKFVK